MGRRAILKHTQVRIALTLTVIAQKDNDTRLAILPIVHLTTLIMWLWAIRQAVNRVRYNLAILAQNWRESCENWLKVISIGFDSLLYGLGVTV